MVVLGVCLSGSSDEPGSVFARSFGHFYDPYHDEALTAFDKTAGARASEWAPTNSMKVRQSTIDSTPRTNINNLLMRRVAMWSELTGTIKDESDATQPSALYSTTMTTIRKAY